MSARPCLIKPCPLCDSLAAESVGPLTSVPGVAVRRGANDSVQGGKVPSEVHSLARVGAIPTPASSTAVDADPACSGSGTTVAGASASTALSDDEDSR